MLKLKPILSQLIWENYLLNSDQCTFLQSWNWGELHLKLSHNIFRFGIYRADKLIGLILLIEIKAKRGHYFECPGGPILDWQNKPLIAEVMNRLKTFTSGFIRIRPNVADTRALRQTVKSLGFIKAPMHLHAESTWLLELNQSEEEIFKQMRKTTRYLIKKAQKLGVQIIQSEEETDVNLLFKLQQETVDRKHFVPFSESYFLAELRAFLPDKIRLFKAVYQGKVLALAMIIFYGQEAVYHYSGSSSQFREVPASYLLQWEVIKTAKQMGLKQYNFWGFTNNPRHRFYGPSLFKKGFGGHETQYLPAHDLPISWSYWLTYLFETIRRRTRHL